ncbi:MAG: NTP transferase domain-containing protein [Nitrososphaeria archaeon]
MAGGKSGRLGYDKLAAELIGIPTVIYTYRSLLRSRAQPVYTAVSNNSNKAKNLLESLHASTVQTPGRSYVDDIVFLSEMIKRPFLTLTADSIFVRAQHINRIISAFNGKSLAAAVKVKDQISYVGLNIVVPGNSNDEIYYFDDELLGISLNTTNDIDLIRRIIWNGGYTLLLQ